MPSTNSKCTLKKKKIKSSSGAYNYRMLIFKACTSRKATSQFILHIINDILPSQQNSSSLSQQNKVGGKQSRRVWVCVEELGLWSLGDSRTAKEKLKLIMTETEKLHVQGVRFQESCGDFFSLQTKHFFSSQVQFPHGNPSPKVAKIAFSLSPVSLCFLASWKEGILSRKSCWFMAQGRASRGNFTYSHL